jgi:hypothetical protein
MLVIKKEDDKNNNDNNTNIVANIKSRSENHSYNVVLYILKNFSDLSIDDQYLVFSKMIFTTFKKESFEKLRTRVLKDYNENVNQESVTITDLKAGYHLSNGMIEMHFDSIEQLNDQLIFYEQEFLKEKEKSHPNIDNLAKISLVVERLINRRSVLNVGTPIILFFRYQLQKQNLKMQQIKEQYEQKSLDTITLPVEQQDKNKEHIQEGDTDTSNNIDELEHYAKLKDPRHKPSRGNTNRQDNTPADEKLRVQSPNDVNSETVPGGQDPSSESYRSSDERRTKEAKF